MLRGGLRKRVLSTVAFAKQKLRGSRVHLFDLNEERVVAVRAAEDVQLGANDGDRQLALHRRGDSRSLSTATMRVGQAMGSGAPGAAAAPGPRHTSCESKAYVRCR